MKKMIVSDYDETLYQTKEQMKNNIEAIKDFQKQGNIFVLSTARPYKSIKQEIDKYNIPLDYLCCTDGGEVFKNDRYLTSTSIDKKAISKIRKIITLEPVISYSKKNNHILEMYYIIDDTFDEKVVFSKIEEILKDYDNLKVCYEYIGLDKTIIVKRCDVSKGTSAALIAAIEKIDSDKVFTIGDGINDIPMIKDFNGFAIRDAKEEVKKLSLGVIDTVSDLIYNVL